MDYVIWDVDMPPGYCVCMGLDGFDEGYKINYGQPVGEDAFPDTAFFTMSRDFPKDIQLADNVKNTGKILVSEALKTALTSMVEGEVEYLPVKIINHKGRVASDAYFVVNVLDFCDALDQEKSDIVWNSINPNLISACYEIVLHEDRIPLTLAMFRLKYFPTKVIVRRDVAERLEEEGFTGLRFIEIADYDGF